MQAVVTVGNRSGDLRLRVQASSFAFYNTPVQQPTPGVNLVNDILSALAGGVINSSSGKFAIGSATDISNLLNPNITNFLNNRTYNNALPKGYLNYILVDEQFNYVSSNSGVVQVQSGASKQPLVAPLQTISKNGYLYVYVSNESPQDVFFDDITVKHTTGPLQQEQSFYPYGLQMSAISSKALLKTTDPYKYNAGSELEEELGYYNTFFRKYDAQIGRFTGVDILAEAAMDITPYQFGSNSPFMFNDPNGDLSSSDWNDFKERLGDGNNLDGFGNYGGSYSGDGGRGFRHFGSDAEGFAVGSGYMDLTNSWGSNGFASSLGAAQDSYYSNGGTDAGVRGVQPSVIVSATRSNGGLSFGQANWGWNGNSMGGEGWSYIGTNQSVTGSRFINVSFPLFTGDAETRTSVPIKYNYHSVVLRMRSSKEIFSVQVFPVTADPLVAKYTDVYGRIVTRRITLYNQQNSHEFLSPYTVKVNWSCAVIGVYTYSDGRSPTWTRMWYVGRSKIVGLTK